MRIKFLGAVGTVTGSAHLLILDNGTQVLLDCGLFQGQGAQTKSLNEKLDVNPTELDAVILSHGHIDHCGRLPLLYKQGFRGKIWCTSATAEVVRVLLTDSAHIQEADVRYINKQREKKGLPLIKPLYGISDVIGCLKLIKISKPHQSHNLGNGFSFMFIPNGHLIGSATVFMKIESVQGPISLAYSGDVGRFQDPLLKSPEPFPQADFMICEATYGNRLHEKQENTSEKLAAIIRETCLNRKGRVIIPAFSLGRTQDILFILNNLQNSGLLGQLRVFVDSPLSASATAVVKKYTQDMRQEVIDVLASDHDPFDFQGLQFITEVKDSKMLNHFDEPCIIISASGMADAGRVKHHLIQALPHAHHTVVISGYCAPETLGAKLASGQKHVRIFGEEIKVNARVETLLSLSAHGDSNELIQYLQCQSTMQLKKIFIVHGEDEARKAFKEKLIEVGYKDVEIPLSGEVFELLSTH